jgi:predicted acyltransferase
VGASIVFSFHARLARGATRAQLAWHTAKRACILFLLGIVVNGFPHFHLAHMRFYGVLQRIAVCYLVVGLFYLWDKRLWTKVAALALVLVGYWVLVQWVPVPGAGLPGRDIPLLDKDKNIVAWLDRQIMPGHLYEDSTTHNLCDPEGLLSDIPAIGTTLLGLLAALGLRSRRDEKVKALGLVLASATCLASGYLWSIWFPLNKKMWTSSYVLVAAGWSLALFALAYWAVEIEGWGKANRRGKGQAIARAALWPWLVFGSNAIAAYMVSELLPGISDFFPFTEDGQKMDAIAWVHNLLFDQIPDPAWAAFAYSFLFTAICFIPVWILYRKKIFLKV